MPRFGKERLRLEPAKGVLCRWKRQERKRTLALLRSRLSKKSTACVDGGASSPARCRGSNFQFEPWQFCLQGKNAESCGFCASCHSLQFPLKSYGFPGAETARKRFLLWEMGFPDAKISTRSRRAGRRERFMCERAAVLSRSPGGGRGIFGRQNHREGCGLSRSPWGFCRLRSMGFNRPPEMIFARGLWPFRILRSF